MTLISSYKDCSIGKFQEIHSAIDLAGENEVRQAYNVMSVLTGHPVEYYKSMKFTDFKEECKKMNWLSDEQLPDKWVKSFTIGKEKFEITQHATEWTAEQFISMTTLTKEPSQIINNLHLIMAAMTKGAEDLTEFDRRAELFKEKLSIEVAYPTGFFFAAFLAKLSTDTQYCLHMSKKINKLKQSQNKTGSPQNGDGTTQ